LRFLFIGVGGAIGSLFRYIVSGLTYKFFDGVFPWGTLAVNLIGSLAAGFLWGLFEAVIIQPNIRTFIFVGTALGCPRTGSSPIPT